MSNIIDKRPKRVFTPLPTLYLKLKYSSFYLLADKKIIRIDNEDNDLVESYGWFVGKHGYAQATFAAYDCRFLHQEVIRRVDGDYDRTLFRADHINGVAWDNRYCNLRIVSISENGLHRTRLNSNNTSGKTGVSMNRGKWVAEIFVAGEKKRLGKFDNYEEAVEARRKAERQYATGFESMN